VLVAGVCGELILVRAVSWYQDSHEGESSLELGPAGGAGDLSARGGEGYHIPFAWTSWPRISSSFGRRFHPLLHRLAFHRGIDLPRPYGTPVFPARTGRVLAAGWASGYGLVVVIEHPDGFTTRYGHLSRITVRPGADVEAGRTLIGYVGSTGLSTGPHLHFEVRDSSGAAVNPAGLLVP
jgi:murein DD-endopeptidase MepM/ murein hydrolase activator NlpD